MKFTLEIELGNDSMRTGNHIAIALRQVALQIGKYPIVALEVPTERTILDTNGNVVGMFSLERTDY